MKTAHHILKEVTLIERRREAEAQEWLRLVRECRSTKWLSVVWLGIFGFFALLGGSLVYRQAASASVFYFAPIAFLGVTSPMIFLGPLRREKALLTLIAREAPDLSRKLKSEGIG